MDDRQRSWAEREIPVDVSMPLLDLSPDWTEEVFGPVLALREVGSFEEAVDATNDSRYGLSASIFTTSLEHALRFADLVDTGQVAVNLPTSGWDVHMPFGGFRESGSAFKEQGVDALRFYSRTKTSPSSAVAAVMRIGVVGAGIIGLAVARRLAELEPDADGDRAREGARDRRAPDRPRTAASSTPASTTRRAR